MKIFSLTFTHIQTYLPSRSNPEAIFLLSLQAYVVILYISGKTSRLLLMFSMKADFCTFEFVVPLQSPKIIRVKNLLTSYTLISKKERSKFFRSSVGWFCV